MDRRLMIFLALLACLLAGLGLVGVAADWFEGHGMDLAAPSDTMHQERCGGCHLAYPPGLLPAGSWRGIIVGQADHFGEDLGLTPDERKHLTAFLTAHAADRSQAGLSRRIMRSLGSATPLRMTEAPIFMHKHEDLDLPPGAFRRGSAVYLGNCDACHPGAAAGDFDEDKARIPAE